MRGAAFLDRDGVIIEERHYLSRASDVALLPGAASAIAALRCAGFKVVVVTNQSGVARGFFTEECVAEVHARLTQLLAREGARVDAYYYCPHHPTEGVGRYRTACACRKPRPGMIVTAARDLGIDLAGSFLAGDKIDDLEAAAAAGLPAYLVRTGYGRALAEALARDPGRLRALRWRIADSLTDVARAELDQPEARSATGDAP